MLVIDKPKLRFLLAGRQITVDVDREYRKNRSYAVGLSHKRSLCRVRVLAVQELEQGFRLTVCRTVDEQPRLLAANPARQRADYVSDPAKAARGEPEALTGAQLRELAQYRVARDHNERAAPILRLRDRLVAELDEALRSSTSRDQRDKLRAARHHLKRIERAS